MALTPDEIDGLRELILAVYGPVTEELLRDLCDHSYSLVLGKLTKKLQREIAE